MKKYMCRSYLCVGCCYDPCDYVYDPEKGDMDHGIRPGTPFEDLPDDWVCPNCGAGKEIFAPRDQFK